MGRGSNRPPWQFFNPGSSGKASNELIFQDFVPFNKPRIEEKHFPCMKGSMSVKYNDSRERFRGKHGEIKQLPASEGRKQSLVYRLNQLQVNCISWRTRCVYFFILGVTLRPIFMFLVELPWKFASCLRIGPG